MKTHASLIFGFALALFTPAARAQTPPTIACTAEQTVECSTTNALVEATVQDLDGDGLLVMWSVNGSLAQTNLVEAGGSSNGVTLSLTFPFSLGTNEVLVEVTDDGSNVVTCTSFVVVQDTTPPVIHSITASPTTLWPPNHKMRPIGLTVVADDTCGSVEWEITSITSNEPEDGLGDGHTAPDWCIKQPNKAWVRAERAGRGTGRVYTLTVTASDESGNTASGSVEVRVPHDRGHGKPYKGKHDDEGYEDTKGKNKDKGKSTGNGNGNGKGKKK